MSTYVEFLKWSGRPNDVPKTFPEGGDHLIGGCRVNFITGFIETLNFDLECDVYYPEANYIQFTANNKMYSWFIDSVTRRYNLFVYHLSLDVLNTYWNDVKTMTCFIERSSSLPASKVEDPKWIIPNGVEHRIIKGDDTGNRLLTMSGTNDGRPEFVITFAGRSEAIYDDEYCTTSSATTTSYMLSGDSFRVFGDKLYGEITILENLQNILFPQDPINGVISVRAYPFNVNYFFDSDSDNNTIIIGDKTYTLSNGNAFPVYNWGHYYLGKINITKKFNDFRDYNPYTNSRLYIPYVGLVDISYENYFETMSIEGHCYVEYSTGDAIIVLYDGNNIRDIIQTTLGCNVATSGNNRASSRAKAITDVLISSALSFKFSSKFTPYLAMSQMSGVQDNHLVPTNQPDLITGDNVRYDPMMSQSIKTKGYFSGVGAGVDNAWYNTRFTPPSLSYRASENSLVFSNIVSDDRYLLELWQDSVTTHEESNQRDLYGKLCLIASRLDASSLTGFVKLRDITLPSMISVSEIRNELFNILTTGFYKI